MPRASLALRKASPKAPKVTQDGNIITASGMAQSLPFALELLRTLAGDKAVEKVAEGIQL